jgi:hypothetical protein
VKLPTPNSPANRRCCPRGIYIYIIENDFQLLRIKPVKRENYSRERIRKIRMCASAVGRTPRRAQITRMKIR